MHVPESNIAFRYTESVNRGVVDDASIWAHYLQPTYTCHGEPVVNLIFDKLKKEKQEEWSYQRIIDAVADQIAAARLVGVDEKVYQSKFEVWRVDESVKPFERIFEGRVDVLDDGVAGPAVDTQ